MIDLSILGTMKALWKFLHLFGSKWPNCNMYLLYTQAKDIKMMPALLLTIFLKINTFLETIFSFFICWWWRVVHPIIKFLWEIPQNTACCQLLTYFSPEIYSSFFGNVSSMLLVITDSRYYSVHISAIRIVIIIIFKKGLIKKNHTFIIREARLCKLWITLSILFRNGLKGALLLIS